MLEASLGRGQFLHDVLETLLVGLRKVDPGQVEVAQCVLDSTAVGFTVVVG